MLIDKYIKNLLNRKKSFNSFLKKTSSDLKNNTKRITIKGKKKFEIEKSKIELKKKYYELGVYVSKHNENGTFDFSYDNQFKDLINNIDNIKSYIENLKKGKINI